MYSNKASFTFGFHGLDKQVAFRILNQTEMFKHSHNNYDWLGNGIYFWESNYERAMQYAKEDSKRTNSTIKEPFVLGAAIDYGNCLDLLNQKNLDFISEAHSQLKSFLKKAGKKVPVNGAFNQDDFDFRRRQLDCAVIRYAHQLAKEQGVYFDSVRAAFWEGELLYDGAGFRKQNHIQIAVLNPNCIKGIFLPRSKVEFPFRHQFRQTKP